MVSLCSGQQLQAWAAQLFYWLHIGLHHLFQPVLLYNAWHDESHIASCLAMECLRPVVDALLNFERKKVIAHGVLSMHLCACRQVTEQLVSSHLGTGHLPPELRNPDLVIRPGGEQRLSNFLLYESAYSELFFCHELWPDFDEHVLVAALRHYAARQRRYGRR